MWRVLLPPFLAAPLAWLWFAPLTQPLAWSLLQAVLAVLVGGALGVRGVRLVLLAAFAPALLLAQQWDLPAWGYALAGALCFALSRNALGERVPFYLSAHEVAVTLAGVLPTGTRLCDLGCGDARLLLALARLRPDLALTGVENAPLAYALARLRWCLAGRPAAVQLRFASLWHTPLAPFDVVYAFLSPTPMARLWHYFIASAGAHAQLVSNTFTVPGVPAAHTLPLSGPLQRELLFWRHPHAS